ncbi:hypothetical protein EVAR_100042_1 [Eumeta japonica]|uniref:Uncharacterized protein n=1 Tax=Eumeta variegata TaxID=151549 RepID=A0A4C1SU19_EUMVA|nr:hypothetical protein EVAR_100042_1 [Eumeta japonica]
MHLGVLPEVKRNCFDEFNQYACIDKSSVIWIEALPCYPRSVDKCMLDKMCLERPDYGYFLEPRVHATTRCGPLLQRKTGTAIDSRAHFLLTYYQRENL